jgi:hypothetical protein
LVSNRSSLYPILGLLLFAPQQGHSHQVGAGQIIGAMKNHYIERKKVRRITTREKVEAQKKLASELGVDKDRWDSLTRKQLDEFWEPIRARYTLAHVPGEGVKYIPNDSIDVSGNRFT